MKTIPLKNIPDDLHAKMKSRAKQHGRSLNSEVLACLTVAAAQAERLDPAELLARIDRLRESDGVRLDEALMEQALHQRL